MAYSPNSSQVVTVWNMPQSALSLLLTMKHSAEKVQIDSQDAAGTIHILNDLYN